MEKFYVKCFMAVAMLLMVATGASAFEDYKPGQKDEALKELMAKCTEGENLLTELMTKEKYASLHAAVAKGTDVWDSPKREDLNLINEALRVLLPALDDARASVEDCKVLSKVIDDFIRSEQKNNATAYDKYEAEGNKKVCDALDELEKQYTVIKGFFKNSENITDEMAKAAKEGKGAVEICKMAGIDIATVEETVAAAGIASAKISVSGDDTEYTLDGAIARSGYKGVVIKAGKKFIKR